MSAVSRFFPYHRLVPNVFSEFCKKFEQICELALGCVAQSPMKLEFGTHRDLLIAALGVDNR